jgi:hypothetical protein
MNVNRGPAMPPDGRRWGAEQSDAAVVARALAQLELPRDVAADLAYLAVLHGRTVAEHLAAVLTEASQQRPAQLWPTNGSGTGRGQL